MIHFFKGTEGSLGGTWVQETRHPFSGYFAVTHLKAHSFHHVLPRIPRALCAKTNFSLVKGRPIFVATALETEFTQQAVF